MIHHKSVSADVAFDHFLDSVSAALRAVRKQQASQVVAEYEHWRFQEQHHLGAANWNAGSLLFNGKLKDSRENQRRTLAVLLR